MSADGTGPVRERNSSNRAASSDRLQTAAPTSASSWPVRYFVAEWMAMSQPCSSGRTWSGVAAVESQTTRAGCATAASKSGIVKNGFDGASIQTRSTPSGGAPRLVELDLADAPAGELVEHHAGAVVAAFGERDGLSRRQQGEHHRRARRRAGGEQERVATVQQAELSFGLGERRAREARVGERPRLAVLVRPRGRAVDRRGTHGGEAITGLREQR